MKYDRLLDSLNLILDEHISSTSRIISTVFFSESFDGNQMEVYENEALRNILSNEKLRRSLSKDEEVHKLSEMAEKLAMLSESLQASMNGDRKEHYDNFNEFQKYANSFIDRLRRIEHEHISEINGKDTLTGLRSQYVLIHDLNRELSACERRGDYVGLAMGNIDHFDEIKSKIPRRHVLDVLIFVSDVIKKNMRLYDDAYRYKENLFVFSFKHTDNIGTTAASERFSKMLKQAHDTPIGKTIKELCGREITMSFSITKLEVGEDVRDLLQHLQDDLSENISAEDSSTILEYENLSPIEKFARGIES